MVGEDHQLSLEGDVGISVFACPQKPAFRCIVKQRYTDFLVNEILPDGRTIHLVDSPNFPDRKRKREAEKARNVDDSSLLKKKQRTNTSEGKREDNRRDGSGDTAAQVQERTDAALACISEADRNELNLLFGVQTTASLLNLYASVVAYPDRKPRDHDTVRSQTIPDKSRRTEAHLCVRRIFESKLETITVQDQDNNRQGTIISIQAAPPKAASSSNHSRNGEGQRIHHNWDDLGGEYLHFTLYKENKDTMEVLYYLASQLKLNIKNFSFAGTKDRRGVTVQRVAIFRMRTERLESLNRTARGWRIGGPLEYKKDGLDLGMLNGNEFLITLRSAEFAGEKSGWTIEKRLQYAREACLRASSSLSELGFINYYGLQRFGTHSTGTHITGMKMLQGDLKGAVDSILTYDPALLPNDRTSQDSKIKDDSASEKEQKKIPQDDIDRAKAIHAFVTTGSSQETFDNMPGNRFQAEKGVIMFLGKRARSSSRRPNENDFQGALMQIQRNLRLMYVHAYQSYVWNIVAGKRWDLYGNKVVEGDLVIAGEKEQEEGKTTNAITITEEVDEDGEPIIHPSATIANGTGEGGPAVSNLAKDYAEDAYVRARPISRTEAESGRFTIFDIVLPLPGYDVVYPSNEIGKFYKDFMVSQSGGGLDPYNMRRAWKDISLSGSYRKMMARPLGGSVNIEVRSYTTAEQQMVETDLEKLNKSQDFAANEEGHVGNGNRDEMDKSSNNEKPELEKIAVILQMKLGTSQYATIALRELTNGGARPYQPEYSVTKR